MCGWWDDFANNLATDLAPFITLFGEAPTKQYLSECLSLLDVVIFAIAPLGVITTVISAIRVRGPPSLRAFIGRAQEGAGSAEAELCSSTSREVCELYINGGGIARVLGRPKLLEIVHQQHVFKSDFIGSERYPATAGIHTFRYHSMGSIEWKEESRREKWARRKTPISHAEILRRRKRPRKPELDFAPNPNLTLNIGMRSYPTWVLVSTAVLGVLLQIGILIWAGIARYRLAWMRDDFQDRYAVPVLVIGSVLLSIGVARCAMLVEGSTNERVFARDSSATKTRLYWVQPGTQFVGDQAFDSFAYTHPGNQFNKYITSWKDTGIAPRTLSVCIAVGLTIAGFIMQFLGLRACHSTVTVAQLGLTLRMSTARSWLRSDRLAEEEVCLADWPELYAGHELDWLALYIGHTDLPRCRREWKISTSRFYSEVESVTARLEGTQLIHRYFGNNQTIVISGFCADEDVSQAAGPSPGWEAPERWRFRAHFLTHNEYSRHCPVMEDTGAVFLYRARLAQLTSDWDDQLVQVRAVARSLVRALEATAKLLYTADDIVLEDGWDSPLVIYWAVPCETITTSTDRYGIKVTCPSSHIKAEGEAGKPLYLSLRHSVDSSGEVYGEWRVNRFELEAMLGLWAWFLRDNLKNGLHYEAKWCRRVVLAHGSKEDSEEFLSWGESRGLTDFLLESRLGNGEFFGWHHVPAGAAPDTEITASYIDADSFPIICAQEIFSIFFASIMHIVRDLGGTTTETGRAKMANSNVTQIQRIFTENGLGSARDAMTCIFPTLKIQGKIPRKRRES